MTKLDDIVQDIHMKYFYNNQGYNSRGEFYTSLVLEAWGQGQITAHNAAEFMGIDNLSHLLDIREDFLK